MRQPIVDFLTVILWFNPVAYAQADSGSGEMLSGTEVTWAREVQARDPVPLSDGSAASYGTPLYFWMRIEGKEKALRELEQRGMLPIRHRWVRYGGLGSSVELDTAPTDEIVLSVGKEALLPGLRLELESRRHFDWRISSMKRNLRSGRWAVDVVYSDAARSPVQCRKQEGQGLRPCHFEVDVR